MRWVSLTVEVDALWAECLSDALIECGALSVEVTDADVGTERETPLFSEPGEATGITWPRNTLNALFDLGVDPAQALAVACTGQSKRPSGRVAHRLRADTGLESRLNGSSGRSRSHRVCGSCRPGASRPRREPWSVKLDPGLAFGTGASSDVAMPPWLMNICARAVGSDYGAAAALGHRCEARGRAGCRNGHRSRPWQWRRNARQNGVVLASSRALPNQVFDVVVANILANPATAVAPC
jgi:ribosomal protein L11 methyltransferase